MSRLKTLGRDLLFFVLELATMIIVATVVFIVGQLLSTSIKEAMLIQEFLAAGLILMGVCIGLMIALVVYVVGLIK